MPPIKSLYEFTVTEKSAKTVRKPQTVDGKEVTVEVEETVETPVKIIFKKPSRRDSEEGELFYAKKLNEFVKDHGLMTRAMLYNKYKDSGGIVSQETIKDLIKITTRCEEIANEVALAKASRKKTQKQKDKIAALEEEYLTLQTQVIELEQYKNSLMENTADEKALNEFFRWLALNMTYIQREDDVLPSPYFVGQDYDAKLADYYVKEDDAEDFYAQVSKGVGKACAVWYMSRESDPEKFKELMDKSGGEQ